MSTNEKRQEMEENLKNMQNSPETRTTLPDIELIEGVDTNDDPIAPTEDTQISSCEKRKKTKKRKKFRLVRVKASFEPKICRNPSYVFQKLPERGYKELKIVKSKIKLSKSLVLAKFLMSGFLPVTFLCCALLLLLLSSMAGLLVGEVIAGDFSFHRNSLKMIFGCECASPNLCDIIFLLIMVVSVLGALLLIVASIFSVVTAYYLWKLSGLSRKVIYGGGEYSVDHGAENVDYLIKKGWLLELNRKTFRIRIDDKRIACRSHMGVFERLEFAEIKKIVMKVKMESKDSKKNEWPVVYCDTDEERFCVIDVCDEVPLDLAEKIVFTIEKRVLRARKEE